MHFKNRLQDVNLTSSSRKKNLTEIKKKWVDEFSKLPFLLDRQHFLVLNLSLKSWRISKI